MSMAGETPRQAPRPAPRARCERAMTRLLRSTLLTLAVAAAWTATAPPASASEPLEAGQQAVVSADGDGLNLRPRPSLDAPIIRRVPDGTVVTAVGERRTADGYDWERVDVDGERGWMAATYLRAVEPEDEPDTPPGDGSDGGDGGDGGVGVLPVPPPGGLTLGRAGTSDVAALVAAQRFDVGSVFLYRIRTQDYLRYVPGAPTMVNTLDSASLTAESIVVLRRIGERGEPGAVPGAPDEGLRGTPNVLPSPPQEGLTVGISGTNDPVALAEAQPFEVRLISYLHVPSQRQLVYVPGAPSLVQSLERGVLEPGSVVWVRAGSVPTPGGTVVTARITYFYCTQGEIARGIGDGGGWCGHMANGEIVHPGAAACARDYLGQRFRIIGDPLDRIYTCKDTGGGVRGEHRDIWFENSDDGRRWLDQVGDSAQLEILADE